MKLKYNFILLLMFCTLGVKSQQKDRYVKIETNYGVMVFRLYGSTPLHQKNFIRLAKSGYFNGYDFNRVIKNFVAQGGETDSAYSAMEKNGQVLTRIAPEFNPNLFHQKGALAAGRDDNKDKTSFTGQFYIVDGKKQTDSSLNAAERRIGGGFHFSAAAKQVYKTVGGVPYLDQNYTVFGQLIAGMEVLDQMMKQPADRAGKPIVRIWMRVKTQRAPRGAK